MSQANPQTPANPENPAGQGSANPPHNPHNEGCAGCKRRLGEDALTSAPRKKKRADDNQDPFVHCGRHFGRTICAMANVPALLSNGLERYSGRFANLSDDEFTAGERREMRIFSAIRKLSPEIDEVLSTGSLQEVLAMGKKIQQGADRARHEDTKNLKGPVVDWITPTSGSHVKLHRGNKTDRGFNSEITGRLLCPADLDWGDAKIREDLQNVRLVPTGEQWPVFLYEGLLFDAEDPWKGLLKGDLLVKGYRFIFTSPSSVDENGRATRPGNARIHGMSSVTTASLAYVATQMRFALMSNNQFVRTDRVTASEEFYNSLVVFLEDPDEVDEVEHLLAWWNERIFPTETRSSRVIPASSALSKLMANREGKKRAALAPVNTAL